jgi:hypothetical protein
MWGNERAIDGTAFRVPDVFGWVTQGRSADGPTLLGQRVPTQGRQVG